NKIHMDLSKRYLNIYNDYFKGTWLPGCTEACHNDVFFFKQKTAYDIGLGIPAEPLFRSLITFLKASHSFRNRLLVICKNAYLFATMIMTSVSSPFSCCSGIVRLNLM